MFVLPFEEGLNAAMAITKLTTESIKYSISLTVSLVAALLH